MPVKQSVRLNFSEVTKYSEIKTITYSRISFDITVSAF